LPLVQPQVLAVQVPLAPTPQSTGAMQQPGPPLEVRPQMSVPLHVTDWQLFPVAQRELSPLPQQPAIALGFVVQLVPPVHVPVWQLDRPAVQSVQSVPHDVLPMSTQALLQS
jgi:hypothetical protein